MDTHAIELLAGKQIIQIGSTQETTEQLWLNGYRDFNNFNI